MPIMAHKNPNETEILIDIFGTRINPKLGQKETITRYTLKNKNLQVQIISYGATITSIKTPDKYGKFDDIVLGFDDIKGYESDINPYFGATVGRYANRISNGSFVLDNKTYTLAKNAGTSHLHGGKIGFDKVNWNSFVNKNKVVFTYLSPDGEEGYPGDLLTTVTYEIINGNSLKVTFAGVCTESTVVNLTNHSYFNLAGHGSGSQGAYNHNITINANKITVLDKNMTATGEFKNVGGTGYDLQIARNLGNAIKSSKENGFDFNYCLNRFNLSPKEIIFAARAMEPNSGRFLEVYTNQPGVQFYTGNFIADGKGKNNTRFSKHSAFCFETQNFPNSVNISSFPSSTLRPGNTYEHIAIYTFGIE